jgi:hypothetical protein
MTIPLHRRLRSTNKSPSREALGGTTLRVYRLIYRRGPLRLSDVQQLLEMKSSSVAEYHLNKLVRLKLIHEGVEGYSADRAVFENMIRIRRKVIPLWATFSAFLATSLIFLLTLLRPAPASFPSYVFSLLTISVSLIVSLYQTLANMNQNV